MADQFDPISPEDVLPPGEPEPRQSDQGNQLAGKAIEQFKSGRSKYASASKQASGQKEAPSSKDTVQEQVKDRAKQKAGQAAKQVANKVWLEAKTAVTTFIADNPVVLAIVLGIILIIGVVAAVIVVSSFGRPNGGGPAVTPTNASERLQVTKLSALSGSQIANTVVLQQTIDAEKARFNNAKASIQKAYQSDPTKAAAAISELESILSGMDAITKTPDLATRQKLIQDTEAALQKFSLNYPEVLGLGAVNGAYLKVPGVKEAAQGDCGAASVLMVTLYYDPAYADGSILDRSAHRSTKGGTVCVNTEYLNAHTPHHDWTRATKSSTNIASIKRSLAGGDPVVIYGARGVIFNNSKHIFVVVGYDPKDDTFFVNNPNIGSVQVHTKTPNNHRMTSANLESHLGNTSPDPIGFGHNFVMMIRSKYL